MKTIIHFLSYLSHFFLEIEMFQIEDTEKIKTHVLCSLTFFFKKHAVYKHVNNIPEWGRPQDNMAHVHCMLDTKVYKYKHYTQVV